MQCPPPQTECVHIDIAVSPTAPPPPPPVVQTIPAKLLAIMQKYPYNWRLEQLSKPRTLTKKFIPKPVGLMKPSTKPPLRLSDEIKFYSDQMCKPQLRMLYANKRLYSTVTKGLRKKIDKTISKTWGTIYNFYKKRERNRRLRQLRKKQKDKGKKPSIDQKTIDKLALPKPVFKPEPAKKPSKIFSNFDRLDELASPKPCHVEPPKTLEVKPAALTYEPTETVFRLAKPPARFLNLPPPLEPGKVKRSALKYKATPRIEVLAQPKQRHEKAEVEDFDPWAISKNALKYKATPRILELAKPVERD